MSKNENISLPEEVEGKGVTVENSEEKTKEEKARFEKQKTFEFRAKHLEPEIVAEEQKKQFKMNLFKWVLIGVVSLTIIFLGVILL